MKTQIYVLVALAACSGLLLPVFSAGLPESRATIYSSGVVQQTSPGTYSYIISVSGSNYQMTDGTTGQIDYQSTRATQVVNGAIGNLTQGGNILIKAGTYTLSGSITATGINNIGLYFEKGAILFVSNGMNAPAINLNGVSNWLIQNPTINGNAANQAVATGSGGLGMSEFGIYIGAGSSNNHVDGANITNCGQYGFDVYGTSGSPSTSSGITNSIITYCGWNGIIFAEAANNGADNVASYAINNEIAYCGDVGISTYGVSSIIQNNYIHDMNGTLGSNNAHFGIAVEGGGNDTITGNTILTCTMGILANNAGYTASGTCDSNTITLNNVEHCVAGIAIQSNSNIVNENQITQYNYLWGSGNAIVLSGANNSLVSGNQINSTYSVANAIYIFASSNNNQISGNIIVAPTSNAETTGVEVASGQGNVIELNQIISESGIFIDSGGSNTIIENNNLTQCTNIKISDSGTATGIFGNAGYNPIGSIASPVRGNLIVDFGSSSTWVSDTTYTNWESPKTLYISGGTVTAIVHNGQTLFTSATTCTITLQPGNTFSVTFSSAPTIKVFGQ